MTDSKSQPFKYYLAQTGSFLLELAKVVLISVAIIVPVRYFLIQPFYVKGASMEPNFYDYEYLIIDEISYRFNEPERGQVVVLHDPSNDSQYFIKRIIGLPGDEISIINDKVVVNGVNLDESAYLDPAILTEAASGQRTFTVGNGEYFVLGDNRDVSYDSRRFGPVSQKEFIGRVWVRAWPFNRMALFN